MKHQQFWKDFVSHLGFEEVKVVHIDTCLCKIVLMSNSKMPHALGFILNQQMTHMAKNLCLSSEGYIPLNMSDAEYLDFVAKSCLIGNYSALGITADDKTWHKMNVMHDAPYESIMMQADLLNACA